MYDLKKLKFVFSYWKDGSWPDKYDLTRAKAFSYSKNINTVYISETERQPNIKNPSHTNAVDSFESENPDAVEIPEELLKLIRAETAKREEQRKNEANRRKFVNAITKGVQMKEVLITNSFLNGATSGGSTLKIEGNCLKYYQDMLIQRIGSNEYMLGSTMSGIGSSNSSTVGRIAPVIASNNSVFWPSTKRYVDSFGLKHRGHTVLTSNVDYILSWVFITLNIVQIKYPTARKFLDGYEQMFKDAIDVFDRARVRWPYKIKLEVDEEVNEFRDIFGDKKKMKKHNVALRMQYEISK